MTAQTNVVRERKNLPYAPRLNCLCDDWECCGADGGTWTVTCEHCGQTWPCEDYIATHSEAEVRRAKRYTNAREYPPWPEAEDGQYDWLERFERWAFPNRAST